MNNLIETVRSLNRNSIKNFASPYENEKFYWPEKIDLNQWFMAPKLISMYQNEAYNSLEKAVQQRLSFYEAINFFSLNIHGEKALLEGLSERIYSKRFEEFPGFSEYLHHFFDEENKHMYYFANFCQKYAGKIYPDKKIIIKQKDLSLEQDFLFFVKIMIFEEIVNSYNMINARFASLEPVSRQINLLHHLDEARHICFGKSIVSYLFSMSKKVWDIQTLTKIQDYILHYFRSLWLEFYNSEIYQDLGFDLKEARSLMAEIRNSENARTHKRNMSLPAINFLLQEGIISEEPQL